MYFKKPSIIKFQSGAVLVTSLVLMVILTALGVSTMRSNMMDINIHKNMKSRANAFQCAEAALRAGEIWLDEAVNSSPEVVTTIPTQDPIQVWDYKASAIQDISTKNLLWWQTNGWAGPDLTNADYQIGCAQIPRYIIEKVGTVDDGSGATEIATRAKSGIDFYRVTAFSVGMENNANVLLQTTFAKRLK